MIESLLYENTQGKGDFLKAAENDWYKKIWTLDILTQSWTEDTVRQVDFLVSALGLNGNERILDLACGYGRHSLEFAKRGFSMVGVDITESYIRYASEKAAEERLSAEFILSDIRNVTFVNEFDVVLNMADGAVGYLESDEENLKIFDVVSKALKPGGKHFMDIMNASYADSHFPCRLWDSGEKTLTLSQFEWDTDTRIMLYGQLDFEYGKPLEKPSFEQGFPTRLYTLTEAEKIMKQRGMTVTASYSDFSGKPSSENDIQLMVCSEKNKI